MSIFGKLQSQFSRSSLSKKKHAKSSQTISPNTPDETRVSKSPSFIDKHSTNNGSENYFSSSPHQTEWRPITPEDLALFKPAQINRNSGSWTNPPDQPVCTPRLNMLVGNSLTVQSNEPVSQVEKSSVTPYRTPKQPTGSNSPYRRSLGPSRTIDSGRRSPSQGGTLKHSGAKTPISSLYNVSSDDETNDEEDELSVGKTNTQPQRPVDVAVEESDLPTPAQELSIADQKAFERRSQKIRRSIDKAKAALPADFADRIGLGSLMDSEQTSHGKTNTQMCKSLTHIGDEGIMDSSNDDDADVEGVTTGNRSVTLISKGMREEDNFVTDKPSTSPINQPTVHYYQSGIQWSSDPPRNLGELMEEIRSNNKPGATYLLKPKCQRTGCQCAFREHSSLILFVVPNVSVTLANWESWAYASTKGNLRSHHSHQSMPPTVPTVLHQVIVFRQCRGWYEILNENHQAAPHLATMEQLRRAKPSTFLVCRDLRCLAAPTTLVVPPIKENRGQLSKTNTDGPPAVPFPSSVVAMATSTETLQASTPVTLPAGTLLQYVTYLPHCPLRRGRKIKEVGLVLATARYPKLCNPNPDGTKVQDIGDSNSRVYYIGLEDNTPAVFPAKFDLVPVAGPSNISGVHSLASVLRKFRLPLSVRPVNPSETLDEGSSNASRSSIGSRGPTPKSNIGTCGLSGIPGLTFSDRSYLKLHTHYRSDILIFSPVTNPERLFLITPSMLQDHLFTMGTSDDPVYIRLQEDHSNQAAAFLAVAHPRDSLNYLIRHMSDVTREQRDTYTSRRNKTARMESDTAGMTNDEFFRTFEELDDLYFFVRHGYYPSKSRRPGTPVKSESFGGGSGFLGRDSGDTQTKTTQMKKLSGNPNQNRSGIPTAEDLLVDSLCIPTRSMFLENNQYLNGEQYRGKPKEYGI